MFWTYFWIGVIVLVSGVLARVFVALEQWWSILIGCIIATLGFAWVMTIWDSIDILARLGA